MSAGLFLQGLWTSRIPIAHSNVFSFCTSLFFDALALSLFFLDTHACPGSGA